MPKYRVTGPDGATYEVNAPEGASEQDVMAFVQQQAGQPEAPDNRSFGEKAFKTVDDIVRSLASGATFGFMDEAAAGANSLIGDQSYDEALKSERERDASIPDDIRIPGEIAGMFLGTVATGGLAGGAGAAARSAPLATRIMRGSVTGATMGGLYGFGTGEGGVENRVENAAVTGALGGVVGTGAPAVAQGVRNLASRLMTGSVARDVGMSRPAYQTLNRAMAADDSFTGAGANRLAQGGPDAMLADAGPNAMSILDTAVQRSGPAATAARGAVEGRVGQAAQNVSQALDDALGTPQGLRTMESGLRNSTAAGRSSAYDAAYAQPIDYATPVGMRIENIITSRVPRSAIAKANALMRAEGERSRQILIDVADDGTIAFRQMPDVRQIDYITRGLNEVADLASAQGKLGGTTQTGRAYSNLSRELRSLTREAVPEYATALDTAAQPIQARNALQLGSRLLSPRMTRDEVAETMQGMSQAERAYVAQGIRSQIDDALANVKRAMTDGNMDAREAMKALKDLSSRAAREKVETVIGPDRAGQLFQALDQATTAFEMRAGVASNSRTFARTQLDDTISGMTDDGVVNAVRSGEPVNAGRRLVQSLTNRTPADKARIADEIYSELVQALTGPRGPRAQDLLQQMVAAQARVPGQVEGYGRLAEMLMRRNPVVTAPLVNR